MKTEEELIGEVRRDDEQVFRLTRREYKRRIYFDLRMFFRTFDGVWRPTKKGIVVPAALWPEVVKMVSAENSFEKEEIK